MAGLIKSLNITDAILSGFTVVQKPQAWLSLRNSKPFIFSHGSIHVAMIRGGIL